MAAWTEQQLAEIARTDELHVAPCRADGSLTGPRTVWAVRVGDDVYIRSVNGTTGAWYRTTRSSHEGHVKIGAVDADVAFADIDERDAVGDRIDAAYRQKYRSFPGPLASIIAGKARATTLRLSPR